MATILVVLFFITLLGYIGFMVQPHETEKAFNKTLTRKQLSLLFIPILVILLIGIGIIGSNAQQSKNTNTTQQSSQQEKPQEQALNSSGETSTLTEDTRKKICYDVTLAQDRAMNEADEKYPIDIFEDENAQDNVEANINLQAELTEKYEQEVRDTYNIDYDTQTKIVAECVTKNWPIPETR